MDINERINQFATDTFKELQKVNGDFEKASQKLKEYRFPNSDPEYAANAAKAKADYTIAENALKNMKRTLPGKVSDSLEMMRREYKAEVIKRFGAEAKDIDMQQLELLKSGIMNPGEYSAMLNDAASKGNATMVRLIAKYAKAAAEDYANRYGADDMRSRELRIVANTAVHNPTEQALSVFDSIADIIQRTVNNPGLIPYWEQLSTPLFKQM